MRKLQPHPTVPWGMQSQFFHLVLCLLFFHLVLCLLFVFLSSVAECMKVPPLHNLLACEIGKTPLHHTPSLRGNCSHPIIRPPTSLPRHMPCHGNATSYAENFPRKIFPVMSPSLYPQCYPSTMFHVVYSSLSILFLPAPFRHHKNVTNPKKRSPNFA